MFWRRDRRATGEDEANRLRDEATPNVLRVDDADEELSGEAELGDEELADEELAEEKPSEAEFADEEADEDEPEDAPEDMTADLEAQAQEYLADNDVWMYGPNAADVLALLDQLEDLDPDGALTLVDAWRAGSKPEREVARKAARKMALENEDVERHLRLARESVGTWVAVSAEYPQYVKEMPDWQRICAGAGEAALDAATALILEEDLDEADFDALYGPWAETVDAAEAGEGDESGEATAAAEQSGEAGEAAASGDGDEAEEDEEAGGAYGPNSDLVTDFLNRLWLLTPEQVGRLVSGWRLITRESLDRAHKAVREIVDEDPESRLQIRRGQEQLEPWLNAGGRDESSVYLGRTGQGEVHKTAGPALADAIAALVVGDLLDPEDAETLYGPWLSLVGAPPLPVPEAGEEGEGEANGDGDDSGEGGDSGA